MRIIYHHRTQLDDAQGIHVRAIVDALRDLGHEVDVISLIDSSSGTARSPSFRIDTARLPRAVYEALGLVYNVYGYRRLARAVRARRADLIYERYAPNTVCGVLASRRFGIPLLLEINAPWHDHSPSGEAPRFGQLARRLERWVCSNSRQTIAVTTALKQRLVEDGVPERQLTVMHNAVDPVLFDRKVSGEEVRRRYRLNSHTVAGFVGWLRDWHGVEALIDAVHDSGLLERGLRLLIVGSGPSFPRVQARVHSLGLAEQVILTGPVAHEDVPAHIAALDIALQPRATAYACPMKLVEYMAMARCIVAPDQPNVRELLRDGVSARLLPPEDYGRLVDLIAELMRAPAVRATLGRNARQSTIDRDLTWRGNAARALALLGNEQHDPRPPLPTSEIEGRRGGNPGPAHRTGGFMTRDVPLLRFARAGRIPALAGAEAVPSLGPLSFVGVRPRQSCASG
jgi:glycosyltransferase involved in cell wall biosynthesis